MFSKVKESTYNVIFKHAMLCLLMAESADDVSFSDIKDVYRGALKPKGKITCLTK